MKESTGYVIGEETPLREIITEKEAMSLLEGAVRAGAVWAVINGGDGAPYWSSGNPPPTDSITLTALLRLEGEPVGKLVIAGALPREEYLAGVSGLLHAALESIIANNLKRRLTTQVHAAVVNRSHEELVETNRRLAASEARYRELAATLEKRVEERTAELKQAHARLLQQEKMASVGQLAAGVAHEINNPLGFICSNLNCLNKYVRRLTEMLGLYHGALEAGRWEGGEREALVGKREALRIDHVGTDAGELIAQSLDGAERVRKIVADLKGFSHIDDAAESPVDLNREIDRVLDVLAHQFPPGTEIVRGYRPLPLYLCNPALLCQVFLNIIQNAIQSRGEGLRLELRTISEDGCIRIAIADNGPGIPPPVRHRVFEPFYTTREVGAGTGMGLAVAYDIVSVRGGTIDVDAAPGGGALFLINLPIERSA